MTRIFNRYALLLLTAFLFFFSAPAQHRSLRKIKKEIKELFGRQNGDFALAFKDLQTGKSLYINGHTLFHAASTMKTPVLIEAYKQAAAGKCSLADAIPVVNYFRSIADTSHFSVDAADDSAPELYKHIGEKMALYDLLYQMIICSSNLATNIVIEKLGAASVNATLQELGAKDIRVLRGVEDSKAFEKGMNNVVTASDLALLFEKMAKDSIISRDACQAMIKILLDQRFNNVIPAKLPAGVRVAHKTGAITGVQHDSGIVFLPNGRKYVLVLLSKNLTDEKAAVEAMAAASGLLYQYVAAH